MFRTSAEYISMLPMLAVDSHIRRPGIAGFGNTCTCASAGVQRERTLVLNMSPG